MFRPVEHCVGGMEARRLALPAHARFRRPGTLLHADARADTGSPFSPLAPLFTETRAACVVHTPVGEDGLLFLVERRAERHFEPEDWEILRALAGLAESALKRVRLLGEIRSLSLTDPLTGLANRRQMEVVLERAWAAHEDIGTVAAEQGVRAGAAEEEVVIGTAIARQADLPGRECAGVQDIVAGEEVAAALAGRARDRHGLRRRPYGRNREGARPATAGAGGRDPSLVLARRGHRAR